jgi:EAL domain-containing protein (putative c-di-GMP-specific phosphodiesterase class I)
LGQEHTQETNARALEGLSLEAELRRALERDEFRLHYQPKVDLRTGRVIGLEALIRWQHPELGMILPRRFISVAEETGLIVGIGQWVLRTACAQNKAWQDQGLARVPVAVNVSAVQLRQEDLASEVQKVLADTRLEPNYLVLELTDSVMIPDVQSVKDIVSEIHRIGVRITLDNFGTGYSSLSYLHRFPIDTLPVARSFVREITSDDNDAAIVRATVGLARSLGMKILTKGVETEEQLALLRAWGCDMMQGYLFSKPLPPDELAELLREGRSLPAAGTAR